MAALLEDHDAGPQSSPYSSTTCRLVFEDSQPFAIPLALLTPIPKLERHFSSWNDRVMLSFPHETGHVLVHYLHTGSYQTLRQDTRCRRKFLDGPLEVGLCVRSLAQEYDIPGLASLSKERVSHFSCQITSMDFLRAVKKVSRWLVSSADDTWLYDLVKSHVHQLFEDPESLDQKGWLELFEPAGALSTMLCRATMEELCYCKASLYTPPASSAEAEPPISDFLEETDMLDETLEDPKEKPDPELELPETIDMPDETPDEPMEKSKPDLGPPEPLDISGEVLEQPMNRKPEAEPRQDIETAVAQAELTWQSGPFVRTPEQLQDASQDQSLPAPKSRKSKKEKKQMKKKAKLALANGCPDHDRHLLSDGDGWKDCAVCTETMGRLAGT